MDFKYLYNPDNGICGPYDEFVARNRGDLIPLTKEEGILLHTMRVGEILAMRARNAAPTASVVIEVNDEPSKEEIAPTPVSAAPAPKGVVAEGEVEKPVVQDEIPFADGVTDFSKYKIYGGQPITAPEFAAVKDEDLVRFAKEVLGRNYEDVSPVATDAERKEYFDYIRAKIEKALVRIYKKRAMKNAAKKKAEADNGGND